MGYRSGRHRLCGNKWYARMYGSGGSVVVGSTCPTVQSIVDSSPSRNVPFRVYGSNLNKINAAQLNNVNCTFVKTPNFIDITIPDSFPDANGPFTLELFSADCDTLYLEITAVSPTCPAISTVNGITVGGTLGPNSAVTINGSNLNNADQLYIGNFQITDFTKTASTITFFTPSLFPVQHHIHLYLYGSGSTCRIGQSAASATSSFGPFSTTNS